MTPDTTADPDPDATALADLRAAFPQFTIWHDIGPGRPRYTARCRQPGTRPHTVVTSDPAELHAVLAAATEPPGELPQAIADDYPGWHITRTGRWWHASCPAMTLQADTPGGLRAALEHAISPDTD